ncbi:U-box domain-containing protein 3 [Senna tora]|uniref:U-box domain-containing protein 3 n=1 Tax=Senna tora TaxID=362788 RepID=A0A834WHF8_9FABA|nr:U-box domain-containing protein 3 [Senna tora]
MEEEVVQNLWKGEREAQIEAAMELSRLSSKQRHKLAETGIMVPLISMLHSQDFQAIEASLCALLCLAFGSERNKIRIVKSGALPVLLNLLQCQSQPLVELTIAAMLTLSSCKANKVAIASSGAIQLLVQFLSENCYTIQSQLDAISTLHNLSTCKETIPLIVSSGITISLLELIQYSSGGSKSSEIVEKAIGLLENVVYSSEAALSEAAGIGGGIRIVVETIEYRGMILREGVMPGLLQVSVEGTHRAKAMARELLLLLRDCSDYDGSTSKDHGVLEQIMQEIDAEGEELSGSTLRLVEEMIAKLST